MRALTAIVFALVMPACSAVWPSPHENFVAILKDNVGKKINGPGTGARTDRYLSSRVLLNGNVENEYLLSGTCRYFLIYDPRTDIIVGWRFVGSDEDCAINP